MHDPGRTLTTTRLLEGLFDPADVAAWHEFDTRYRPVVTALAQRLGLSAADAADVAQETFTHFLKDYGAGKYDRNRGRLRSWIVGIARHRIAELRRVRAARREWRGESAFLSVPDDEQMSRIWDEECHKAVIRRALADLEKTTRFSPRTLEAFRRHVVEQQSVAEVAADLGLSVRAVYLAKHRCLGRLREILASLKDAYEIG